MTKLFVTAATAVLLLSGAAQAGPGAPNNQLPQKFRGDWVEIDNDIPNLRLKLTGSSVSFGSTPCKFIEVSVANESSTAFSVKWLCPGAIVPIEARFELRKIWGKEVLVESSVVTPSDASVSIYARPR
jgi:hypothetical protein